MKIRYLTLILFLHIMTRSLAQDPHFSNFKATLPYSDPSSISTAKNQQASILYRNQWPSLKSAFVTYGAYYLHPLKQYNSAVSFQILQDIQGAGAISKSSFSGIYSYTVKASKQVKISGGIQISWFHRKLNREKLEFESDITGSGSNSYDPGFENYKNNVIDFSLGISAYFGENFYSGIAVQHITKPPETSGNEKLGSLNQRYVGYVGGIFPLNGSSSDLILKPAIQFQRQDVYNEFLYGSTLVYRTLEIGLWARNDVNFSFDALILLIGYSFNAYTVFYSYDANLKSMRFFSPGIGAHEVTFLCNFKYKEKRKRWAQ